MNFVSAMQGLVVILWIIIIGLIVIMAIRASRGVRVGGLVGVLIGLLVVTGILTILSVGLVFIEPEERGVVISALSSTGYRQDPLTPGLHLIIPFFERVERYKIARQTYTMSGTPTEGQVAGDDSIAARTSDGQEVSLDASVIYAINPENVIPLHIIWQKRYTDEVIRPISRGIIRDAVSQYKIEEVYSTRRAEMVQQITDTMAKKLAENNLVLNDFVLRNITFSPEYAASVEQKQIAQQQAEQAKFVVEQRKQEAEQARQVAQGSADSNVIQAQGRAKSRLIEADAEKQALELIAQALATSPDLLNYQYITKLAPGIQAMLLPSNQPFLLPLPTLQPGSSSSSSLPALLPTPSPTAEPLLLPTPTPTP